MTLQWHQIAHSHQTPFKVQPGDWYALPYILAGVAHNIATAGCAVITVERERNGSVAYYALHIRDSERRAQWHGYDTYYSLACAQAAAQRLADHDAL